MNTCTFASFRSLRTDGIPHDGFAVAVESEQVVSGLHLTRVRFGPIDADTVPPAP